MATVCQTCGDRGFDEQLVYCDSCKVAALHRYCLGITPVPFAEYITWFCEDCDGSDSSSDCKEVDQTDKLGDILNMSEKKKKTNAKENEESSYHTPPGLSVDDPELQDTSNVESVEVSSSPVMQTMEESERRESSDSVKSDELTGLVRNEASVLEVGNGASISEQGEKEKKKKKKKKKRKNMNHSLPILPVENNELPDATNVEPVVVSKKRQSSDELNSLVRNEASVLEARNGASVSEQGEKEKKKKKKRKSINHPLPILPDEDHELSDTTNVEPGEVLKKRQSSDDLNGLVRNEVSVLEKRDKKKKKKKKTNKEVKKNEESSNHTLPVLAGEDHEPQDTTKETTNDYKRRDSGKPHELTGLVKSGASVSEAGNSSTVPDHSSCTSKKNKLSSGNMRVTSENTQLDAENNSCKVAESNMPQTSEKLTAMDFNSPALNNDRAQPICKPIWRGSIFLKKGNICSIDGVVAHLSTLACGKVHEKASSLHARLSAEMFPRLEIWPDSFLKNGPPTDESIALYFFPSSESNDIKVYYSLVGEMKRNDLAMRCVLDNVELLLFTSYQLPMHCWTFYSKEYLWGIFRRRKTSRR